MSTRPPTQALVPPTALPPSPAVPMAPLETYLRVLSAGVRPGLLFDVRYRTEQGRFARLFLPAEPRRAAATIARLARRADVYVGCALRVRRAGTRADVAPTALLWADCDTPHSLKALAKLPFEPTMIVASGSPGHAHAYWRLTRPLSAGALERANRCLAATLGADVRCTDPARILRPPGTLNHKHRPPRPVTLSHHAPTQLDPDELTRTLPVVVREPHRHAARRIDGLRADGLLPDPHAHFRATRRSDPLQRIKPAHYIRLLTGLEPDRDGKIPCPFHPDRTPSLHVYETPEQGWTCFSCQKPDGTPLGGDIYTFASQLLEHSHPRQRLPRPPRPPGRRLPHHPQPADGPSSPYPRARPRCLPRVWAVVANAPFEITDCDLKGSRPAVRNVWNAAVMASESTKIGSLEIVPVEDAPNTMYADGLCSSLRPTWCFQREWNGREAVRLAP